MTSRKEELKSYKPKQQLELLELQCKKLAPDLYRTYALYLQDLRDIMLSTVHKAVLFLLTNQEQNNFGKLNIDARKTFQSKIDAITSRCISLLTVEHLMDLSRHLEEEKQIRLNQVKEEVLMALSEEKKDIDHEFGEDDIHLSLYHPLDQLSSLDDINDDASIKLEDNSEYSDQSTKQYKENDFSSLDSSNSLASNSNKDDIQQVDKGSLSILKSLFLMAGETITNNKDNKEKEDPLLSDKSGDSDFADTKKHSNNKLMPQTPIELFDWTDHLEIALTRRLRNLSHAINVELLRVGILNSIFPLSLLDASLSGQVHSQDSESNLLKLKVPLQNGPLAEEIDIICLLIRVSDLEFDDVRLKSCRNQINQQHNLLLKMVKQQRYWQKRSIAIEVHQQWLQTPNETSSVNPQDK